MTSAVPSFAQPADSLIAVPSWTALTWISVIVSTLLAYAWITVYSVSPATTEISIA